jgi:predicted nuclease of restriction endonuclease-like RecB superfamily
VKKELELLRQKQKEQEEAMKTQERSFWEHIAQLKKKWEVERENFLRESEKMLQHKLKVSLHGTW